MGLWLALLGFAVVNVLTFGYFLTIDRERVPEGVGAFAAGIAAGLLAAIAGIALAPGAATIALGALSIAFGGLILYLLSIRKLPEGRLIARVGEPMPAFAAFDEHDASFDLASLAGQRVMVKFFRGSW